jgi:HEAT repeat protein
VKTNILNKYVKDLSNSDDSIRRHAAQELAEADERAIFPLIKALRDDNYGVQDAAMHSLISIGGEVVAHMVVPLLRKDPFLRNTAVLILTKLGRVSVPLLYPLLHDKDQDIRKFCLDILGEIKEDVLPEKIIPLIGDLNANVRAAAIKAIGEILYKDGVPDVISALQDDEWVAFSALDCLGKLKDEKAVAPISGMLSHSSEVIRSSAIETLGKIGSVLASDALLKHIPKAKHDEKAAAIRSLVQIGITPSMSEVADVLMELFEKAEDWDDRNIALKGLVELKESSAIGSVVDIAGSLDVSVPEDEEQLHMMMEALKGFGCVQEFMNILKDFDIKFRAKVIAAGLVGELGCEEAVPLLIDLLQEEGRDIRRASIEALGKMPTPESKQALLKRLNDHDSHIRKEAISSLGRIKDKDAFDKLLEHLDDTEEYIDVLEEAVKALLMIDPGRLFSHLDKFNSTLRVAIGRFSKDLDILLRLSSDEDLDVRLSSISGLGTLGMQKANERLKEVLKDKEPETRRTAVMALIGNENFFEDIKPLIHDDDMWVRLHAVRALGESDESGVLQTIKPALKDEEVPVVLAVVDVLKSMGGSDVKHVLKALLKHKNDAVREAAGHALEKR